jgi:acetyl-CoA carboxylase biotin carboxyl carrier protein
MAEYGFELEDIARLIRLVETRGLEELILEEEGRRILIRGASARAPRPGPAASANASGEAPSVQISAPSRSAVPESQDVPASRTERIILESPMVGVFYRAARPDLPPFVDVGDRVESGQTIGMIEAMKVFSEIPAEHAGIVVEIAAQNGQLVSQGEPLMYLIP